VLTNFFCAITKPKENVSRSRKRPQNLARQVRDEKQGNKRLAALFEMSFVPGARIARQKLAFIGRAIFSLTMLKTHFSNGDDRMRRPCFKVLLTVPCVLLAIVSFLVSCQEKLVTDDGANSDFVFRGQAIAVQAKVFGITTTLANTGPLGKEGGAREASMLTRNIADMLTAKVIYASTIGQADRSRSEAALADLRLTVGNDSMTVGFVMARSNGSLWSFRQRRLGDRRSGR
jgi:hypothetical protein